MKFLHSWLYYGFIAYQYNDLFLSVLIVAQSLHDQLNIWGLSSPNYDPRTINPD